MESLPSLEGLGLTRLEALAYVYLVANPRITGYKVSKGIGKPTANVYRALESLERKGAVTNDRASPPLYRAVPPPKLLDQLEREFADRRAIAAQALASLEVESDADDDGFFALKTADQIAGRLRIMLAAARRVVLIDTPAERLTSLENAVADARSRGARVVVLVRGKPEAAHEDTIAAGAGRAEASLRAVADAREALIATVPPGDPAARDAVWSRSLLFARTLHEALANEWFFVRVERGLREGMSVDEMESAFERCRVLRGLARA